MRSTNEIRSEMESLRKQDERYNRLQNEGGEGYERDSAEALQNELMTAMRAEFLADWTAENFATRREIWNNAAKSGKYATMIAIESATGLLLRDLHYAKTLHGVA